MERHCGDCSAKKGTEMTAKLAGIYLTMVLLCTASGFLAGESVRNIEKSFIAHQRQMYFGVFPSKVRGFEAIRWQEQHNLQLQLITLSTTVAGFLLGVVLINRNEALSNSRKAA